jgi:hypothetical protein
MYFVKRISRSYDVTFVWLILRNISGRSRTNCHISYRLSSINIVRSYRLLLKADGIKRRLQLTAWLTWGIPKGSSRERLTYGIPKVNHAANSNLSLVQSAIKVSLRIQTHPRREKQCSVNWLEGKDVAISIWVFAGLRLQLAVPRRTE